MDEANTFAEMHLELRECYAALNSLLSQKPSLSGLICGSTTLGNRRAELGALLAQAKTNPDLFLPGATSGENT